MSVYLSEYFDCLAQAEIQRLQKMLNIILRHKTGKESLKCALQSIYVGMGRPLEILNNMELGTRLIFLKLLESFGILPAEQLSKQEKEILDSIPFTVWLNERCCVISAEALEYFAGDPHFKKEGYLFAYIRNLPVREKKSWLCWLDPDSRHRNGRESSHAIYQHLTQARMRMSSEASDCSDRLFLHNSYYILRVYYILFYLKDVSIMLKVILLRCLVFLHQISK